jgi:uncharacterized surface protein with fasciclin (FAS1) repeats
MSLRKSTLATAILLGLGLNVSSIETAVSGEGCGRMNAAHANPGYGHHPMARTSRHGYSAYGAPMMQPGVTQRHMMQPAVYWGSQPPRLVKTGMADSEGAAPGNIVEVAVGAGSFETLVTAVKAAGLVETLQGEGPFTVFAPTDEAFAKIPTDQLDALLADKEALTAVLTYHVVPGKVMAADVVGMDSATTVQGGSITIDTSDGVKVDGANVVKTDIEASNGVIHVIDAVIMPR